MELTGTQVPLVNVNHSFKEKDLSEISIWLDNYDDMFSDFDPRPYAKRTLSDDFFVQVRKVTKGRYKEQMCLKLLLPERIREVEIEEIIAKRLHDYFSINFEQLQKERKQIIVKGITLTITGFLIMFIAGILSFKNQQSFLTHLILILCEPAGWFLLWMGLDQLVYYSGKTKKELDFFTKMANAEIGFDNDETTPTS